MPWDDFFQMYLQAILSGVGLLIFGALAMSLIEHRDENKIKHTLQADRAFLDTAHQHEMELERNR